MSEHQTYDFLAVDRPLSAKQIEEVREFSSRAEVSSTHFSNVYNYGDFRGSPEDFVTKYFDIMVYTANWGTRRLLMGFDAKDVDATGWKRYISDFTASIHATKSRVLLEFFLEDDSGEYELEQEGWIESLPAIREELLTGDERPLFLAWLASIGPIFDQDDLEEFADGKLKLPPIPAGLNRLSAAQKTLVTFLQVDKDLLAAAATKSGDRKTATVDLRHFLASLSPADKDEIILSSASGENPHAPAAALRRYRQSLASAKPSPIQPAATGLTEILKLALELRTQRDAAERERLAREQARRQAEEKAARKKRLAELSANPEKAWKQVEQLIQTKLPKSYDQAVEILKDLNELANLQGAAASFGQRFGALRESHRQKTSLLNKFREAKLRESSMTRA